MDRPSAEDGTSETVEEGDNDIPGTASIGCKHQSRGLGIGKPQKLVEDVRNLGPKRRIVERLFCKAGRSPARY